ncbi:hypothetical protein F2P56_022760 [Juglans regia]|uniref:glucan endo-1,3-beta-D-glucosidase n=1 Tax=Juglans regia TaxID=51240 RepID=A0A833WNZ7_JUGRE|nr:hypothetical protein F2P56_022760 [Juglans regia]
MAAAAQRTRPSSSTRPLQPPPPLQSRAPPPLPTCPCFELVEGGKLVDGGKTHSSMVEKLVDGGKVSFSEFSPTPLLSGIIPKDFAVFGRDKPYFWDSNLGYWNMFDALVDAFYWAISKVGDGVYVAVAATGWPSAGNGNFTTSAIAAEYNQNLMEHIVNGNGTLYAPWFIDGFLYSLYNEDKKPVGPRQHFGLFNPNQTPAYPFSVPHPPPTPEAERVIKG